MSSRTFFISDMHFHLDNSAVENLKRKYFFDFLHEVRHYRAKLFILGDLFDFWFEYKSVIPKQYTDILTALKKTVEQGCQVHIIVGNHDFWIGEYFTQELGISVHYKPIAALLNKQKFLLIHGDGILKNDRGYRMLKKLLRSPVTIRLFRIIHPDLVYKIARKVSKFSRKYSMKKIGGENTETTRKELIQFAEEQFQQGIQNVIMGHYHLPIIYQSGEQVFINLGDWMQYFSYAIFDGRNLSLCYWPRSA